MTSPFVIAKTADGKELAFLPALANRHGLITGATGTGKTVTLQVLADNFSRLGVPVFLADVKGDLSGLSAAGSMSPKLRDRLAANGLEEPAWNANPTVFWDVLGHHGFPVRATISDLGPLLLSRLLRIEPDTAGRARDGLQDRRRQRTAAAGPEGPADDAAVRRRQRAAVHDRTTATCRRRRSAPSSARSSRSSSRAATKFFGEPMLDVDDLLQTDRNGRGMVNILAADELIRSPKLYSTFLLWMLSELFEHLPEVGDPEKPTLVFFFDEAHLLFTDAPAALVEKIEQVVRLIRSKGVGVYFVTQSPSDIPDTVLGQLGNRVQHALARLYAARPEGGQDGGRHAAAQSEARRRLGDHRAGRGRGARLAPRCEGESDGHRARLDRPARVANRSDYRRAARRHPERGRRDLRSLRTSHRSRVGVREAAGESGDRRRQERQAGGRRGGNDCHARTPGIGRHQQEADRRSPMRCRRFCWEPLDRAADITMVSSSRLPRAPPAPSAPGLDGRS